VQSSADAAAAYPIAPRILQRVASVTVAGFGEPIGLTCSIGVAASDTLGAWGEPLIGAGRCGCVYRQEIGTQSSADGPPLDTSELGTAASR
jgi:hypothetical protein